MFPEHTACYSTSIRSARRPLPHASTPAHSPKAKTKLATPLDLVRGRIPTASSQALGVAARAGIHRREEGRDPVSRLVLRVRSGGRSLVQDGWEHEEIGGTHAAADEAGMRAGRCTWIERVKVLEHHRMDILKPYASFKRATTQRQQQNRRLNSPLHFPQPRPHQTRQRGRTRTNPLVILPSLSAGVSRSRRYGHACTCTRLAHPSRFACAKGKHDDDDDDAPLLFSLFLLLFSLSLSLPLSLPVPFSGRNPTRVSPPGLVRCL